VLSSRGELGAYLGLYSDEKRFVLDAELNAALSKHIADFLRSYLESPDDSAACIAIIYGSKEKKPWGNVTFLMDESVVRDVYPVSGTMTGAVSNTLTAFQKRNQEKSIYRGMEALLGHKETSHLAIYCPVLFDRGTTLDRYLGILGREEREGDRLTPVIEVLNLVANIPVLARNTLVILGLREKLHAVLVKNHMRRDSGLALVDNLTWPSPSAPQPIPVAGGAPDGVFPAAGMRGVRSTAAPGAGMVMKDFSKLHVTDRHAVIERWQVQPPRPIAPLSLQGFTPFQALSDHQLLRIADQCLLYQAPAGTRLLERGMNDKWNLFLVSGTLLLEPQDGVMLAIESQSERAASPVSSLKPRKYQAVAKTPVTFLWIPDALLRSLAP